MDTYEIVAAAIIVFMMVVITFMDDFKNMFDLGDKKKKKSMQDAFEDLDKAFLELRNKLMEPIKNLVEWLSQKLEPINKEKKND